ncbi:hypothetical protein [Curtobacterium sp. MCSS17_008]|uniref:hypothetical protein n=1 Tax=Curtobacterium sp. MCSS17_008 TaxID=2175647 RepID=UPI0011B7D7CE|nr:hypothetical protein [Curtobacterium sp. MCSS17_008]
MGDIAFDADEARSAARVARRAAETLRGQAGARSGAVEPGLEDFEGSYAERFRSAAVIEAEDRARLAGVLVDLASQIGSAVAAAERERERQRAHAEWKARDADRKRAATAAKAFAGAAGRSAVDAWESFTDPEPSTEPEPRPEVDAEFRGRERARYGDGASGGRSSADPSRLQAFVTTTSGLDTTATAESEHLRSAWASFRSSCAWVTVDRASMPAGFERYVRENDEDRSWIGKVADAFEAAGGGGSPSNVALDIAATGRGGTGPPTAVRGRPDRGRGRGAMGRTRADESRCRRVRRTADERALATREPRGCSVLGAEHGERPRAEPATRRCGAPDRAAGGDSRIGG